MGLFGRKAYSRRDSLTAATEAQQKGKQKKAIAEYKKILENDGPDPAIHNKLAMALAESKKRPEAREHFLIAARGYDDRGFIDKALAVYVTAAHYLPGDVDLVEAISEAQLRKQRHSDALKVLLDARKHFRRKKQRPQLLRLLERACQIEPWHFEASVDMAHVYRKMGDRYRAKELLEALALRNTGAPLRRARAALFWMSPTPASAWRWLRALFQ
jgi:tetratricopeptide (TPR) repeat protein